MIKHLVRDWGVQPAIVRMSSTDTYAAISAPGYITAQQANIIAANNGNFEWDLSDTILVWYQNEFAVGAWAFFSISSDFSSLIPFSSARNASITLSQSQVQAAYAAPQLLVAAPGAGKAIVVTSANVITEVSTAFSAGGVAIVQYGATIHGAGVNALSATIPAAEINAASSQMYSMAPYAATTVTATSAITGLGLYFSNATAAFAGGAGSTVTLNLNYQIISAV